MGRGKSLRITIVSDFESWINNYIENLLKILTNDGHIIQWVHDILEITRGDLVFFLGCKQIVPEDILLKNKHNLVVHASDLPQGKGWSPLTWKILEGENKIHVTLFEAVEKVDSGTVYLRDMIEYKGTELIDELRKRLAEVTIRMCLGFIHDYPGIVKKGVEQAGQSTYYKKRTPAESRIDPDKTIREQFNLLRVVDNDSYPAFFEINGQKYILKIEKA